MERLPSPRWRRLLLVGLAMLVAIDAAVVGIAVLGPTEVAPEVLATSEETSRPRATVVERPLEPLEAPPADDPTLTPPAAAAPLRRPEAPPANPYVAETVPVIGQITIPKLGLDAPLNQGVSLTAIDRGPSHWPGTALPGEPGNVVIAGHRVTKTRPFRHIDTLVQGDEVIFTVDGRRFVYRVTATEVVTPDAMHIVAQTPEPTATLFACHPPGSARYRYVVKLALDGQAQP